MKYKMLQQITDFGELQHAFEAYKSIYCRHRPYPVAFLQNWSYRLLKVWIDKGWMWIYEKNN